MDARFTGYRHAALVVVLSAAVFVAYFSRVLFHGDLLAPSDALNAYLPSFLHARTPWDLLLLCGFPYLADAQNQGYYLSVLLRPFGTAGWNADIIMAYAVAAASTYGYVYSLTGSRLSACISAFVYSMSGVLVGNMRHVTMIHTVCWLPLAIWSLSELKRGFTMGWFTVAATVTCVMAMAGFPQSLAYNLSLEALFVLTMGIERESGRIRVDIRYFGACLAAVAIGLGACAVQLLPLAELAKTTPRLSLGRPFYDSFRFDAFQLILILFPGLAGIDKSTMFGYDYVGPFNFVSSNAYVGLLPLMLIPAALLTADRKKEVFFWAVMALVSLLLAMGSITPVGWLAYFYPPYGIFRAACKHLVEAAFAVAVLAGVGAFVIRNLSIGWRKTAALAAVPLLIFVAALLYAVSLLPQIAQVAANLHSGSVGTTIQTNPAVWIPVVICVAGAGVLLFYAAQPTSRLRQAVLILMIAADMSSFGQFLEWSRAAYSPKVVAVPRYAMQIKETLLSEFQRGFTDLGNGASYFELPNNLAAAWGIPMANGEEALIPRRTRDFFSIFEGGFVNAVDISAPDDHALDLGAVRYLAVPKSATIMRSIPTQPERFVLVKNLPTGLIYENRRAMPRVWMVSDVKQMPAEQILQMIRHSDFDPRRVALIEEAPPPALMPAGSRRSSPTAKIAELRDTSMTVNTQADSPQFLVTSDTLYPGWQATIDGQPTQLYQANYILRGVLVPAGNHTVEFKYIPQALITGGVISCLFLLIIPGMFLYRRVRLRS